MYIKETAYLFRDTPFLFEDTPFLFEDIPFLFEDVPFLFEDILSYTSFTGYLIACYLISKVCKMGVRWCKMVTDEIGYYIL